MCTVFGRRYSTGQVFRQVNPSEIGMAFHRVKIEELKIVGLTEEMRNNRKRKEMKKSFFGYEFLEDLINVFPMTNIMDLDDMVLVVDFINDPKSFHNE
jgi:hypothetical protein